MKFITSIIGHNYVKWLAPLSLKDEFGRRVKQDILELVAFTSNQEYPINTTLHFIKMTIAQWICEWRPTWWHHFLSRELYLQEPGPGIRACIWNNLIYSLHRKKNQTDFPIFKETIYLLNPNIGYSHFLYSGNPYHYQVAIHPPCSWLDHSFLHLLT